MARMITPKNTQKPEPALLGKPREEVRSQLLARVDIGNELVDRQISSLAALDEYKAAYNRWNDYNAELLRRVFTTEQYVQEYSSFGSIAVIAMRQPSMHERISEAREQVVKKRDRLLSIIERLDLIDEAPIAKRAEQELPVIAAKPISAVANNKVFVVHGQDEEAKAVVARFITDLAPISPDRFKRLLNPLRDARAANAF